VCLSFSFYIRQLLHHQHFGLCGPLPCRLVNVTSLKQGTQYSLIDLAVSFAETGFSLVVLSAQQFVVIAPSWQVSLISPNTVLV
jgi:hypothetical protein